MSSTSYLNTYEVLNLAHISIYSLQKYRQNKKLIEGLHYFQINRKSIRYDKEAIEEWIGFNYNTQAQLNYRMINSTSGDVWEV